MSPLPTPIDSIKSKLTPSARYSTFGSSSCTSWGRTRTQLPLRPPVSVTILCSIVRLDIGLRNQPREGDVNAVSMSVEPVETSASNANSATCIFAWILVSKSIIALCISNTLHLIRSKLRASSWSYTILFANDAPVRQPMSKG